MSIVNRALSRVRSEVQRQHPYKIGVPPGQITAKLNQNESPFDVPDELREAILASWQKIAFHRYPAEQPDDLAELLADYTGWDERGIIIGNGANELTYTLGLAFIAPRSRVVLPRPMFSFYERIAGVYGGKIISVAPLDTLAFDTEGILEAIRRTDPSMVVITSPNNPTGLVVPLEEIKMIAQAAPGLVLIDEAYAEFADEPSLLTVLEDYPNVILLRTLSKAFGLAGLRIGYLIGVPDLMSEVMKARAPFMTDRFSICAVKEILRHRDMIRSHTQRICSETRNLMQALKQIRGVRVLEGQANFVTFQTPSESKEILEALAVHGVLVRDMSGYPELRGFLRVSTGTPDENRMFVQALTGALSQPSRYSGNCNGNAG